MPNDSTPPQLIVFSLGDEEYAPPITHVQVSCWPSSGQATMAFTRRGQRQPEDDR